MLLLIPACSAAAAYVAGARSGRAAGWPACRTVLFLLGLALAVLTVLGPLPALAHTDFAWLALSHVVAGMLAPLLLVLSRPVTLALRVMDKAPARRLVQVLRSTPARMFANPLTATVLTLGGMYLMFRTPLLEAMRAYAPVHWILTFHLLAAGYLWTAALIGRDPNPHRAALWLRAGILVLTTAAHNVLAKSLYANPPAGVRPGEAESGAMAMYYAGGAVETAVMILFCLQWYRSGAPRRPPAGVPAQRPETQKARSAGRRNGP